MLQVTTALSAKFHLVFVERQTVYLIVFGGRCILYEVLSVTDTQRAVHGTGIKL
jgi:hypothetical protein